MTTKRTWTCTLLAVALTVTLATNGLVLAKGKPPQDPPPPPEPPPVLYVLNRFMLPADYWGGSWFVGHMNNGGQVVGSYDDGLVPGGQQPLYFDPSTGNTIATNLNTIQFDAEFDVPDGWYITRAHDINDLGDIAAALALNTDPERMRGCVIELIPDPFDASLKPRLHLIPEDLDLSSRTYVVQINDAGVVLGRGDAETAYVYRAPLHGQIGDTAVTVIPLAFDAWYEGYLSNPASGEPSLVRADLHRLTGAIVTYNVDNGMSSVADISTLAIGDIRGMNDAGEFCGYHDRQGGKYKRHGYYFDGAFHSLEDVKFSNNINDSGDVIGVDHDYRPTLHHPARGTIFLDDTIVALTPEDQALWDERQYVFVSGVSERSAGGFPLVAGTMQVTAYADGYHFDGYVLVPVVP